MHLPPWTTTQYPWTLAEAVQLITGEVKEMETGDKEEEDHLPEEMYLHQDMETPPRHNASIVEKRDTMHRTALQRDSNHAMRGITNRPTSLT